MAKKLHYLFDPLCGWCYGAIPALAAVADAGDIRIELLPTGLFSGRGARSMDEAFADYAWSNDQRIERLTGQPFTHRYRTQVLANHARPFDSGPATVALTAVSLTEPGRELDALKAIQSARYVDGRDVTDPKTLNDVLKSLGQQDAAALLESGPPELLAANQARIARAQAWMRELGARGVPAFVLDPGSRLRLVPDGLAHAHPGALLEQLRAA